jgi:uncharacterized membrane protein YeaQ/YmgE (transglycosylase-associated protein family)
MAYVQRIQRSPLLDSGGDWNVTGGLAGSVGIVGWLVVGAIVGMLAGRLLGRGGAGCLADVPIGMGGGLLGGALYAIATGQDALFTFRALSLVAAAAGAAGLVWVGDRIFRAS